MLINTVPCTFWVVFEVFSQPQLLQDIRNELSTVILQDQNEDLRTIQTLNIAKMRENCPLLPSVFQETLRTVSTGSSIRHVRRDFFLADRYLLKEGSILQMPFPIIHRNEGLWGKTVKEYDPRRFLKPAASSKGGKRNLVKPGTFRGFGGGTTLCPGRHFATMEITSVVAMLVARFDIEPVAIEGWKRPKSRTNFGATSVTPPVHDVKVRIRRREGYESSEWRLDMKGIKVGFVAGDSSQ